MESTAWASRLRCHPVLLALLLVGAGGCLRVAPVTPPRVPAEAPVARSPVRTQATLAHARGSAQAQATAAAGPGVSRAALAAASLRQVAFGSVSLLPVRFTQARLTGPVEEAEHTYYCVSARMHGRTFGTPERPKAVFRVEPNGHLTPETEADEVCAGQRSVPFPELEEGHPPSAPLRLEHFP